MDDENIARACADSMYANDRASRGLGMSIEHVSAGRAVLSMTVTEAMLNGHDVCHGGFIFALADSAFAFACNSMNINALSQRAQIDFLAPALLGDRLTATAEQRNQSKRTGVYDVSVSNQAGRTISLFRGNSYRIGGEVLKPIVKQEMGVNEQ